MTSNHTLVWLLCAGLLSVGCEQKPQSTNTAPAVSVTAAAILSVAEQTRDVPAPAVDPQGDDTERWIETDDMAVYRVVDPFGAQLAAATDAYKAKDNAKAAEALSLAAKALTAEGDGVDAKELEQLKRGASALETAAKQLTEGKLDSKAFNQVVSDGYSADIENRWELIDAERWFSYYDQPAVHFERAQAALSKDPKLAGVELAKVASYVRLQALHASGESKDLLAESLMELSSLATQLYEGKPTSQGELDDVVYDTSHALSFFHYHQVISAMAKPDGKTAARELQAAIKHVEALTKRADAKLIADVRKVVDEERELANSLQNGAKLESQFVNQKLKSLEQLLTKLRRPHAVK